MAEEAQAKPRKLLLPVDDSDVTHVAPVHHRDLAFGMPGAVYPMMVESLDDNPKQARVLDKLEAAGIPCKVAVVHYLTDNTSVGEAICCRADEIHADKVVMANHQRGKLATFFVGSACDYCVKRCRRPLVLLDAHS